jgi:hypothetical protein
MTGAAKQSAKHVLVSARSITASSARSFPVATAEQLVLALVELKSHIDHFIENKKWE